MTVTLLSWELGTEHKMKSYKCDWLNWYCVPVGGGGGAGEADSCWEGGQTGAAGETPAVDGPVLWGPSVGMGGDVDDLAAKSHFKPRFRLSSPVDGTRLRWKRDFYYRRPKLLRGEQGL